MAEKTDSEYLVLARDGDTRTYVEVGRGAADSPGAAFRGVYYGSPITVLPDVDPDARGDRQYLVVPLEGSITRTAYPSVSVDRWHDDFNAQLPAGTLRKVAEAMGRG